MTRRKLLLLQLPVQSHDYEYSKENIPLALGYLQSFAQNYLKRTDIHIVPPRVVSYGGDAAILKYIEQEAPEMVGFGCALWNVERTLNLCRELKRHLPDVLLILGGPEVNEDNTYLFGSRNFDFAITGEGEETLRDLLLALEDGVSEFCRIPGLVYREEGNWTFNASRAPMESLDAIPSPYLGGLVAPSFLKTMALETVRGCPHRCAYCYYHKSLPRLRTFDLRRIEAELMWALDRGIEEVYFVDPCFARRPELARLLNMIRNINRQRSFRIQCELNAEDVSPALVQELALAGVVQVEVGLQTTNPEALKLIQRRFQPDAFQRGIRTLRGMGIRVLLDLMVGLPGDSLANVKRSIDFVLEHDLCDELKLYPLSVLPGTQLRQKAQELSIRYQQKPPYLVLETAQMGSEDIFSAFRYAEEARGGDFFPIQIPLVSGSAGEENSGSGFIHEIILDPEGRPSTPIKPEEIGQSLSIYLKDPDWQDKRDAIHRLLYPLIESNRFTLVDWIIPEENYPSEEALRTISDISLWDEHPLNREYFATHSVIRSTQVFILGRSGGYTDPVIIKVPLYNEEALLESFPFGKHQKVCWVAFPQEMEPDEEDIYIEMLIQRFRQNMPGLRLSDAPEEGFWNREDPLVRAVSVNAQ